MMNTPLLYLFVEHTTDLLKGHWCCLDVSDKILLHQTDGSIDGAALPHTP